MLLHVLEPVSYGLDFTLGHSRTREQVRETWTKRLEELASSLMVTQCTGGVSTAGWPSDRFDLRFCQDPTLRPHRHGHARAPRDLARLFRQRGGGRPAKSALSCPHGAQPKVWPRPSPGGSAWIVSILLMHT